MSDQTQFEEVPEGGATSGWFFVLMHLAIGGTSIALVLSPDLARGRAAFSHDAWKVVLGLVGAGLTYFAVRGIARSLAKERARITPGLRQRLSRWGKILMLVGVFFFLSAAVTPVGEQTIAFDSWARPLYIAGGLYLFFMGLLFQWNPTRAIRQARVAKGEGRHGTARLVRANDTGLTVNDDPQVKIDFEITVDGAVHQASDKIVMDRAKLALLIPGSTVNVLVDRIDANVFHIDWDSWQPPAAMRGDAPPASPATGHL